MEQLSLFDMELPAEAGQGFKPASAEEGEEVQERRFSGAVQYE